jgi:hypothetical protein
MFDTLNGVAVVAVLTLLGAAGWFFSFIFLTAFGAMGRAGQLVDAAAMFRFYTLIIPPLVLSLFSVIAVVGIFKRSRFGWHLCILLWILSVTYLVYVMLSVLPLSAPLAGVEYALVGSVILVNLAFIVYFRSAKVKGYFKISGQ